MAQRGVQVDREFFPCSICLNHLEDPVTIPCGHNYCLICIKYCWGGGPQKGKYSCPQCRQIFPSRPALVKNTMLAVLVEKVKKSEHQTPDHCTAGLEDVACDFCTGRKLKALKSCLTCLASYCEQHLQPHYIVATFKKHKLVSPTKKLQENICTRHDETMKLFCRTDQQCVCFLCSVDKHKGHDTVTAAAERAERNKELEESLQKILKRILTREREEKLLQQEVDAINRSASKTEENSEKIFNELIRLLQRRSSEVKQQIRSRQHYEVGQVQDLRRKLREEIMELKKRYADLKQVSSTEDHIQFLLNYLSLSHRGEPTESTSIRTCPQRDYEDVMSAVLELRDKLQGVLTEKASKTVTEVNNSLSNTQTIPKTRDEFLQYFCAITLDPKTVNPYMVLSGRDRKATVVNKPRPYLNQPNRFADCCQALSRESLKGRVYWELEWAGEGVCVAVAYKTVGRTGLGNDCKFGHNAKSWALHCYHRCFWHNNKQIVLPGAPSSKVGVYLDHEAGTLCFYSVSDTMTLLHRVQTTFTQPLYAGVRLHYTFVDSVKFTEPK